MKSLYRFMILALAGFTLGAGIAYWQSRSETPVVQEAPQAAVDAGADAQVAESAADSALNQAADDVAATAPQDSAATSATEMAAADAPGAAPAQEQVAGEDHAAMQGGHDHAAMMAEMSETQPTVPPVAGSAVGGAFSLTDHNGNAVTNESWPGKYKLVFFGFTHCPDICPAALDKMTAALTTLGDKAQDVQPLFITIDPARDDAAALKAYLASYHASILGLTGSEEQVKQVEDAYKVYAAKVDTGTPVYTMAHSSFVFLLSPDDQLLEIFRDGDPAEQMAGKIGDHLTAH